jgi:hypothetical protein
MARASPVMIGGDVEAVLPPFSFRVAASTAATIIMTARAKKIVDYGEDYEELPGNAQAPGFVGQLFKMVHRGPANMILVRPIVNRPSSIGHRPSSHPRTGCSSSMDRIGIVSSMIL